MTAPAPRTAGFTGAVRQYWWVSALCGLYFTGGYVLWGGSRDALGSSAVFFVAALGGLMVDRQFPGLSRRRRVTLIMAHLLIGHLVLVWQMMNLPLSDYTATGNPADRDFLIYLVSAMLVGTLAMFGGLRGVALGLAMHFGFIFDVSQPFTFKWAFPVIIALAGNIISSALWRLDEAYEKLETLADRDALTALFNRRRLPREFERLQGSARAAGRALLLVAWDLDGLKAVNDRRGHAAGDAFISDFARTLAAHVRHDTDARDGDAAFRVGGDEFISLHLDAADGDAVVARVHQAFPAVSAGWVRADPITLDQALTLADQALYAHKRRRSA